MAGAEVDVEALVPPACPLGYTREQVEQITAEKFDEFAHWMRGQTAAICDGRHYDYGKGEYEPTTCADAPHGMVIYAWDLARWIRGGAR